MIKKGIKVKILTGKDKNKDGDCGYFAGVKSETFISYPLLND